MSPDFRGNSPLNFEFKSMMSQLMLDTLLNVLKNFVNKTGKSRLASK